MDWSGLVWAGFVAVVVATAVLWVFRSFGLTTFSPSVQLGCLVVRNPLSPAADTLGFFLLLLLGSTLIPAAYAQLFEWFGGPTWTRGAALGILHGVLTAAALPMLGTISACVRSGAIPAPGPMGIQWGWLTPLALTVGHAFYGAVCGAILANL